MSNGCNNLISSHYTATPERPHFSTVDAFLVWVGDGGGGGAGWGGGWGVGREGGARIARVVHIMGCKWFFDVRVTGVFTPFSPEISLSPDAGKTITAARTASGDSQPDNIHHALLRRPAYPSRVSFLSLCPLPYLRTSLVKDGERA